VAFACGAVVENSGEIKVYYGAADTCVCVATTDFKELVAMTLVGKSS
jgi:beta-1,4-mannooligosaccharide/beta-1,4-mannosyl-N-acetylglucosamine phosphorylase